MRGFFVTGTDTGVGKTTVSAALLGAAVRRGLVAAAMKPIETGCRRVNGELVPSDALVLRSSASRWDELDVATLCPYRFEPPVAPSIAAREAGIEIDPLVIERARRRLLDRRPDLVIAEGAGGLLVPIGDHLTIADVAVCLAYPLIVVARDRLGVLNHLLLTLEAARTRGLEVAGVILNAVDATECLDSNLDEIRRVADAPLLGRFPPLNSVSESKRLDLAMVAEQSLALELLYR